MQIGVAYSEPGQQIWLNIEVPDTSTVADGIERFVQVAGMPVTLYIKSEQYIDLERLQRLVESQHILCV